MATKNDYGRLLRRGGECIAVWGSGYIGYSTMAYFARAGVRCIGYDTDRKRVADINAGRYIMPELKDWLGFPVRDLARRGLLRATTDRAELAQQRPLVHFLAIPTERDGKPYFAILRTVLRQVVEMIRAYPPAATPLVIIESTLSPRTSDTQVLPLLRRCGVVPGRDLLYGIAPRRDWFVEGSKNLRDLDRVYGGYDAATTHAMRQVLGIVCRRLHCASNCYVAEMVKSFENAYRHVEITLANQISLAYPSQNIREALALAGTKWNIGTFRPGFGTGGYCIPVASRYVLDGAEKPEELSILRGTIATDSSINARIADSVVRRGAQRVAVLGLSYKGNLKVSILSPTLPFVRRLLARGVRVQLHDPYFTPREIRSITGAEPLTFPRGLRDADCVVLVTDHAEYRDLPELGKNCRQVLDNPGFWTAHAATLARRGINYHVAGDAHWLD